MFVIGFVAAFGALLIDQVAGLLTSLPNVVSSGADWSNRTFGTRLPADDIVDSLRLTPERIQQIVQELTPGVAGSSRRWRARLPDADFPAVRLLHVRPGPGSARHRFSSFPPRQQHIISTVWDLATEKAGSYVFSRMLLAILSAFVTAMTSSC